MTPHAPKGNLSETHAPHQGGTLATNAEGHVRGPTVGVARKSQQRLVPLAGRAEVLCDWAEGVCVGPGKEAILASATGGTLVTNAEGPGRGPTVGVARVAA
ncbi:hypothetical protein T484DRAFT_1802355 [Baffinella frigidus]|nr:hypothetical protein T484DRAFT_1802355 [Cryptophyta sp. CCMP2293]